mmetsp:Transcript_11070/g.22056  ORF Transcript_11070/g.22056 Transcript_11070/m.22056 type:complete len:161 (-) Transcript_11070:1582-2064(-)
MEDETKRSFGSKGGLVDGEYGSDSDDEEIGEEERVEDEVGNVGVRSEGEEETMETVLLEFAEEVKELQEGVREEEREDWGMQEVDDLLEEVDRDLMRERVQALREKVRALRGNGPGLVGEENTSVGIQAETVGNGRAELDERADREWEDWSGSGWRSKRL